MEASDDVELPACYTVRRAFFSFSHSKQAASWQAVTQGPSPESSSSRQQLQRELALARGMVQLTAAEPAEELQQAGHSINQQDAGLPQETQHSRHAQQAEGQHTQPACQQQQQQQQPTQQADQHQRHQHEQDPDSSRRHATQQPQHSAGEDGQEQPLQAGFRRSGRLRQQQSSQQAAEGAGPARSTRRAGRIGSMACAAAASMPSFRLALADEDQCGRCVLPLPGEHAAGGRTGACVLEVPARAVLAAAAASGVEGLPKMRKAKPAKDKPAVEYCDAEVEAAFSKDHAYWVQNVLHSCLPEGGRAGIKAVELTKLHLLDRVTWDQGALGGCWEKSNNEAPQLLGGLAEIHAAALLAPAPPGGAASPFEDSIVWLARKAGGNNAHSWVLRRPEGWREQQAGSKAQQAAAAARRISVEAVQASKEATLDALFFLSHLDSDSCRTIRAVLAEAAGRLAPGAAAELQQSVEVGCLTLRAASFGFLGKDKAGAAQYITRPLFVELGPEGRRLVWGTPVLQAQLPPVPWFLALDEKDLLAGMTDRQRQLWGARKPLPLRLG
ncbi:hypothetical protein ABPG75_009026 [Micractinium tetrahymenae]